jgi:hypothetical protein
VYSDSTFWGLGVGTATEERKMFKCVEASSMSSISGSKDKIS